MQNSEAHHLMLQTIENTLRQWQFVLFQTQVDDIHEPAERLDLAGIVQRRAALAQTIYRTLAHPIEEHILHIMQADGWVAVYDEPQNRQTGTCPLACFALVEDTTGRRRVIGLTNGDGILDSAEIAANFLGYARQRDHDRAERYRKTHGIPYAR